MESFKKNSFSRDLLYLTLIFIASLSISLPLFKGHFLCSSDYAGTLMRLLSMKQCLGHGQWIVRWVPDLYRGYGYPVFNFYPPVFYALGTLIANLGAGIVAGVNLSLFIFFFLSGCAMYLFACEFWGKEGAFVSALAYLFAPYHIVDLYVRTAAAETAAFVFLPLILWSFYKSQQRSNKRYMVFSALSVAGLLLTHNCISLIFFPWVIFYILLLYWPYSPSKAILLLKGFFILALGVGLAAFFWLPALIEKKFVHTEMLYQGNLNFTGNFIYFKDLISPALNNSMPYFGNPRFFCRGGLVHALIALTVLLGFKKIVSEDPRLRKQMIYFFIALIVATFLTLNNSRAIWEHIKVLQYIQFPFRFLTISMLAVGVLAGGTVRLVRAEHRLVAALIAGLMIFATNSYYCHPRDTFPCDLRVVNADPHKFLSELVPQDGGEYIPIWVKDVTKLPKSIPTDKLVAFAQGGQVLEAKKISPLHYKFVVVAQQLSLFCFNSFYFPGWTVNVDGRQVDILKDNPFGLIIFPCPDGVHNVEVYFGTTPLRQIAQGISIASLVLLGLALLFLR